MDSLILKPEIKASWLEALRSGEYQQGKSCLRTDDDKFCCLGVLCDLYDKQLVANGSNTEWKKSREWDGRAGFIETFTIAVPPVEVMQWATTNFVPTVENGLGDAAFAYQDGNGCLTGSNDSGKTFSELADIIEKDF